MSVLNSGTKSFVKLLFSFEGCDEGNTDRFPVYGRNEEGRTDYESLFYKRDL